MWGFCNSDSEIVLESVFIMSTPKVDSLLGILTIKLKDNHFAKRSFEFKAVLKGYKLFDHFDSTSVCPLKFVIHTKLGVTKEYKSLLIWLY